MTVPLITVVAVLGQFFFSGHYCYIQEQIAPPKDCTGSAQDVLLSQRWAGTVCKGKPKDWQTNPACKLSHWTIHGLWPNKVKGTAQASIPDNILKKYESQMKTSWTFLGPSTAANYLTKAKEFLNHEWKKHGVCAIGMGNIKDADTFISETLKLYNNNNILNTLNQKNIKPDANKDYPEFTIRQAFATTPALVCDKINNVLTLAEIHLCFDNNLRPKNCNDKGNCKGKIKYPPALK